jgi:hypothetical protein
MRKYAMNYSLILGGYIEIQAASKRAAIKQFDNLSDEDLITNCDEVIEVNVYNINGKAFNYGGN